MTVAAVSFVSYIIAGAVQNVWIALPIALFLMLATLQVLRMVLRDKRVVVVETDTERTA